MTKIKFKGMLDMSKWQVKGKNLHIEYWYKIVLSIHKKISSLPKKIVACLYYLLRLKELDQKKNRISKKQKDENKNKILT